LLALSAFISIDLSIFSASEFASESLWYHLKQLIRRQKVKMQQQIIKGFDYFLKQNELGKTDSKNMNRLLQMMDENGL
jgi:hypothetical protein